LLLAHRRRTILPDLYVTASRLGSGITGTSTTVITAEEIARSPALTIQDILATQPGIQVQSLFGAVNGAQTSVDMRGFGATATSNTLILLNGRRLNDVDIAGVDLSAIPRQSIERIEITRGNSGAVLYGDGAVGGVINIVTKSGADLPPKLRIEGAYGSYQYREGNLSGSTSSGPFSASVFANTVGSAGYRLNNQLRQNNAVGELRYKTEEGSAYFNLSGDDQHLGLPGGRRVTLTSSELVTDRNGTSKPYDYADKQGFNATTGITRMLADGVELVVDGGFRQKRQQAGYFGSFVDPSSGDPMNYVDTRLNTASFTPRIKIDRNLFSLPSKIIAGLDMYNSDYVSNRSQAQNTAAIHHYALTQRTLGVYWQQTIGFLPNLDVSYGYRLQRNTVSARDQYDPSAPGGAFDVQGDPLDMAETQRAMHLGAEYRLTDAVTLFGRIARSFRLPNVDERVGQGYPTNFSLRTQTSRDVEGGIRLRAARLEVQSSVYDMRLNDEIMYSPATFSNINLDPTRRYGTETLASYPLTDTVRLKGSVAYTRAVFREGVYAGNDVPLVSRWSGSAGVSWNVIDNRLVFDATARFFGPRRMDNDQANFQPLIPGKTLVDLRIGGEVDRYFWSFAVQNVFNVDYYDYAIASSSTYGTYNAYPQPGRTFLARAGVTW
jgi:iron complex outermembrane receptor protein